MQISHTIQLSYQFITIPGKFWAWNIYLEGPADLLTGCGRGKESSWWEMVMKESRDTEPYTNTTITLTSYSS